eukprot:TRINITY_DN14819_c0_g1_i2.p1 TRINITY_DN14819_c0_g1~~TRINITY_DN14819_c0_g1_i2.p1  ORF type:complete len:123 (-),score=22.58 TRINITY_DN14819_c0_g1_i2:38-406(-)
MCIRDSLRASAEKYTPDDTLKSVDLLGAGSKMRCQPVPRPVVRGDNPVTAAQHEADLLHEDVVHHDVFHTPAVASITCVSSADLPHRPPMTTRQVREWNMACLLYTSPSPRDRTRSRMPSSA